MSKDKDRDLIDKMNRALTEEIQTTLEKVLAVQLKPISTRLAAVENKLEKIEKEQTNKEKH